MRAVLISTSTSVCAKQRITSCFLCLCLQCILLHFSGLVGFSIREKDRARERERKETFIAIYVQLTNDVSAMLYVICTRVIYCLKSNVQPSRFSFADKCSENHSEVLFSLFYFIDSKSKRKTFDAISKRHGACLIYLR